MATSPNSILGWIFRRPRKNLEGQGSPNDGMDSRQSATRHRSDHSGNEGQFDPRHGGVQVSTSGAPQQNQAPGVASHLIHFD